MKRITLLFASLLVLAPACDKAEDTKADPGAKPEAPGTKVDTVGLPPLGAGVGDAVVTDGKGNTVVTDGVTGNKIVTDSKGNAVATDDQGNTIKTDASGAIDVKSADGTSVKVDKDGNVQIDGVKLE